VVVCTCHLLTMGNINGRISMMASLGRKWDLISKITRPIRNRGMNQVVEHLSSECKTLSSVPPKNKEKERNCGERRFDKKFDSRTDFSPMWRNRCPGGSLRVILETTRKINHPKSALDDASIWTKFRKFRFLYFVILIFSFGISSIIPTKYQSPCLQRPNIKSNHCCFCVF
jgi:hypothetical protein